MSKLAVLAIGGNSLIKDDRHASVPDQYRAACETISHTLSLLETGYSLVVTHGNGPQAGFILLRSELGRRHLNLHEVPLDYIDAFTQGGIGYIFQRALHNEFKARGWDRKAVAVVTQVVVDRNDPSLARPSKPIGSFYTEDIARIRQEEDGWLMMEDSGRGWRRLVASPRPQRIVELDTIKLLLEQGHVVICVGGGGIPVVEDDDGTLHGIEAVIDKDLASSLLARELAASLLIISTGVEKVCLHYGTPQQRALDRVTLAELEQYTAEGHFKPGSMLPKVQAVVEFLWGQPDGSAIITHPDQLDNAVNGLTGTHIRVDFRED